MKRLYTKLFFTLEFILPRDLHVCMGYLNLAEERVAYSQH